GAPLPPRAAPSAAAPPAAAPSRPAAAPADAAPQPAPAIARSPAVAGSGYVVQVGVFSNVANAEEVRARLALHGIPSQIEARVHIGPFKSRAEADQARQRLRALGMDSGPPTALKPAAVQR
ncbi:SPOR domain-containing protein, partial [Methyloversatilis discipulorum]|uniref:SPOR domain-containing protein n=1 Tax=Methyloversatilis discipulorum TaxID=1119528 RepID=UPI003AF938E3